METKDLRVKNLNLLISEEESAAEFARKHNLDPTYISQLLKGHRAFGERSARNFEEKIGLPLRWFDIDHSEDAQENSPLNDSFVVQIPFIDISGKSPATTSSAVLKKTLEAINLKQNKAKTLETNSLNMSPTIGKGSQVLIDTSDTTPKEGGIYLIQDGELLSLIRLIYEYSYLVMDSVWMMKNDNPNKQEYPDKFLPQTGNAKIIGRVVWYDNRL